MTTVNPCSTAECKLWLDLIEARREIDSLGYSLRMARRELSIDNKAKWDLIDATGASTVDNACQWISGIKRKVDSLKKDLGEAEARAGKLEACICSDRIEVSECRSNIESISRRWSELLKATGKDTYVEALRWIQDRASEERFDR